MPRQEKERWFICPLNGLTNQMLAGRLPAENAQEKMLCEDGKKRDMWQCEYSTVAELSRNSQVGIRFIVWHRESQNSKLRLWKFESTARKK